MNKSIVAVNTAALGRKFAKVAVYEIATGITFWAKLQTFQRTLRSLPNQSAIRLLFLQLIFSKYELE